MSRHDFQIPVSFKHRVCFTRGAFAAGNSLLSEILAEGGGRRVLVAVEESVARAWPELTRRVESYFADLGFDWRGLHVLPGGEAVKVDDLLVRRIWEAIDRGRIDRHSYLIAIGGGAFLDAVGYAAATAHRGVRLVRFPTTTLSQDDSGVGVKCAINGFGKKNWIGAFAVPFAVINDFEFLHSQDEETRRAGLIEAVKVSLVKDGTFFEWIEQQVERLAALEADALEECVERSALLHARHISEGGDAFETGSSRPLDFGHWAAHKLEQLSGFALSHAHAVAVGLALDTLYSARYGLLRECVAERVIDVVAGLRLPLWHPALELRDAAGRRRVHEGLEEFREHLGGELTVLLLREAGVGQDVHVLDEGLVDACLDSLRDRQVASDAAMVSPRG
ncbi:MAG: 3-dehydroquinate synthase [Verrucomicrobia bacterium]|nr:MAG: 3-dehydroquinate synthase [Verrucomicrobiota bacterium]TAE88941.1 MAG: 3-dehydroquinate synthase [Verrucomicrobiota bacterium]TAF27357.1 MAG: 3-dehydroquinate synthase [Verrucomicrobiota bacterium]TAF42352.1 MAG: 3-dehydroquinate synthase [Verrucomicrobiota bacterium]